MKQKDKDLSRLFPKNCPQKVGEGKHNCTIAAVRPPRTSAYLRQNQSRLLISARTKVASYPKSVRRTSWLSGDKESLLRLRGHNNSIFSCSSASAYRPSQQLRGCIRKSSYQLARVRVGSTVEDLSDFS